jgi:hypothetical protein
MVNHGCLETENDAEGQNNLEMMLLVEGSYEKCLRDWRKRASCCKAMVIGEVFMARKRTVLKQKKIFVNT